MDNYSLAHTKWNCKYQIVFTPKYRRKSDLQANFCGYRPDYPEVVRPERSSNHRSSGIACRWKKLFFFIDKITYF